MNDTEKYRAAFALERTFDKACIKFLCERLGGIDKVWKADLSELLLYEFLSETKANNFLKRRNKINPDAVLDDIKKKNLKFFTYEDEIYPELLRNIPDPPGLLFYEGNTDLLKLPRKLAVVGSRKASTAASSLLTKILSDFEDSDLCIVSGMAAGIDTVAHKAALKYNMPTIAVLGAGFDNIYPPRNVPLFNEIIRSGGLVLTEYFPEVIPMPFQFPQRNRIVTGMSNSTLVAEAGLNSGALISARLCLEYNRELLCIPGPVTNPNTAGIYKLLKEGAGIVTESSDILNANDWSIDVKSVESSEQPDCEYEEDTPEKAVLDVIRRDTLTLDEIAMRTDLKSTDLMIILTKLELEGLITQTEGAAYRAE